MTSRVIFYKNFIFSLEIFYMGAYKKSITFPKCISSNSTAASKNDSILQRWGLNAWHSQNYLNCLPSAGSLVALRIVAEPKPQTI